MHTFVLLALIGTAFAAPELNSLLRSSSRIVGGTPTDISQYPYMSNMQTSWIRSSSWAQACGGSLLTPNTILSAAHCYGRPFISVWRVRLGTSYASSGGDVHAVSGFTIHEQYGGTNKQNDIALVHLAVPANILSPNIGLARIAGVNYTLPDNTVVTAIGWGRLSEDYKILDQVINFSLFNKMLTFVLLALIGTAFAAPEPSFLRRGSSRIVGGTPVDISQYPYMSNMQRGGGTWWGQACGGSLLTRNTVLSAAHCYFRASVSSWRVRLGTSFSSSGGDIHALSRFSIHPQYNSATLENDIALVHLVVPANLQSPNIGLARIPGPNYILPDNTRVTAIGWGALWTGGPAPEQLQHVDVNIINQQLCYQRYLELPRYPDITNDMLCAGILDVGGKDACQGDSGGPLAHLGDIIVGVTSWGYECADSYWPGVNARVSVFSEWINQTAF